MDLLKNFSDRNCLLKTHKFESEIFSANITKGDAERELGIPFSPLCDRETTLVSQSQIGFIDFIITPTYILLCQLFSAVNSMLETKAIEILKTDIEEKVEDDEVLRKVSNKNSE